MRAIGSARRRRRRARSACAPRTGGRRRATGRSKRQAGPQVTTLAWAAGARAGLPSRRRPALRPERGQGLGWAGLGAGLAQPAGDPTFPHQHHRRCRRGRAAAPPPPTCPFPHPPPTLHTRPCSLPPPRTQTHTYTNTRPPTPLFSPAPAGPAGAAAAGAGGGAGRRGARAGGQPPAAGAGCVLPMLPPRWLAGAGWVLDAGLGAAGAPACGLPQGRAARLGAPNPRLVSRPPPRLDPAGPPALALPRQPSAAGAALEKIASFKDLSLQALEEGAAGWAADRGTASQPRPARQLTTEVLLQELAQREGCGRPPTHVASSGAGAPGGAPDSGGASSAGQQANSTGAAAPEQDGGAPGLAASSSTHLPPHPPGVHPHAQPRSPDPAALPPRPAPACSGSSGASSAAGGAASSASRLRQLPFEQRAVEVVSVMCPGVAAAASELAAAAGEAGTPVLQQLTCRCVCVGVFLLGGGQRFGLRGGGWGWGGGGEVEGPRSQPALGYSSCHKQAREGPARAGLPARARPPPRPAPPRHPPPAYPSPRRAGRSSGVLLASSPPAVRALLQREVMAMSEQDFLQVGWVVAFDCKCGCL